MPDGEGPGHVAVAAWEGRAVRVPRSLVLPRGNQPPEPSGRSVWGRERWANDPLLSLPGSASSLHVASSLGRVQVCGPRAAASVFCLGDVGLFAGAR